LSCQACCEGDVTYMTESCHVNHVVNMNKACHAYGGVMPHTDNVTCINESRVADAGMSHIRGRVEACGGKGAEVLSRRNMKFDVVQSRGAMFRIFYHLHLRIS